MVKFKEMLMNEALNKDEFIKFIKNYFDNPKYNNTYAEEDFNDVNIYNLHIQGVARPLLSLNLKTGNIKIEVSEESDKQYYKAAKKVFDDIQVKYWDTYGSITDNKEIRAVLNDAGITDIEEDKNGITIFRKNDSNWYMIYKSGEIEKYNAKKNIDKNIQKMIMDEWKKLRPNLKWYFKWS